MRNGQFVQCQKATNEELLCISFNHFNPHLFATGGEQEGIINTWDLRNNRTFLNDLNYHSDKVNTIEWSPFHEHIFMSGALDAKIFVWDHSKVGEEQARHDYEDGPPEMLFP